MSITEVQSAVTAEAPPAPVEGRSPWRLAWARLRSDRVAIVSGVVILVLCALALAAPLIASAIGHQPNQPFPNSGLTATGLPVGPGGKFWFGTDDLGRDILVRTLYGARVSLFVGIVSTAIAATAGISIGMVTGYFGGAVDAVLARVMDAVLAFPYVLLALALAAIFGANLTEVIGVIAFFSWAGLARIVRGQTLSIKEKEYIEAARSIGASPLRIMTVDILPNVMAPVLVISTLLIPVAVVFESTLSFLGAGIQLPTASWGNMISVSLQYYQSAWWYLVFPAAALLITTLAFNLLGDGVRDALDPRTERMFAARRGRRRR
ncbi:MAG: ABC transporter permease, partial [Actinobacteria bacterium]|nr:ABC transporter permease [Actinomycetota bacterium]